MHECCAAHDLVNLTGACAQALQLAWRAGRPPERAQIYTVPEAVAETTAAPHVQFNSACSTGIPMAYSAAACPNAFALDFAAYQSIATLCKGAFRFLMSLVSFGGIWLRTWPVEVLMCGCTC